MNNTRTLLVRRGRVSCPRGGDALVAGCVICPWFRGVYDPSASSGRATVEQDRRPQELTCAYQPLRLVG